MVKGKCVIRVMKDRTGLWRWRLRVSSDIVCTAHQGYHWKSTAVRQAKKITYAGFVPELVIDDD